MSSQSPPSAEGVLITGVYGSGKSSVAAEIAHLLEQRRRPYALLDLDYLGRGGIDDVAAYFLIAASVGVGVEDLAVADDRPIGAVAAEIMSWLGWQ